MPKPNFPLYTAGLGLALTLGAVSQALAAPGDVVARLDGARVVTVAEGLDHPWGLAFLPDGRMLVSERPGRLRLVAVDGALSQPLAGVPEVAAQGQGGLLDVALDPDFADNSYVYLSFAEPGSGGSGTAVARGKLGKSGLSGTQVIFRQIPKVDSGRHFGSRLVFARDGTLFVTMGDRGDHSDSAQDLSTHIGTITRIDPDGSVPQDNPFVDRQGALPEIWSYGHRNIQGAALDPRSGRLWIHEHGARGGDEINMPEAGRNYGWPVISYGRHYSGAKIGVGTAAPGMEQPVHYWDPSIAPSGMTFYSGKAFPDWRHNLFVGALRGRMLVRLELDGNSITREHRMLQDLGERIRAVAEGPDGHLYLLTDNLDGRILRIEPDR